MQNEGMQFNPALIMSLLHGHSSPYYISYKGVFDTTDSIIRTRLGSFDFRRHVQNVWQSLIGS